MLNWIHPFQNLDQANLSNYLFAGTGECTIQELTTNVQLEVYVTRAWPISARLIPQRRNENVIWIAITRS